VQLAFVSSLGAGVVPGADADDARADNDLPTRPLPEHHVPAALLSDRRQQVGRGFDQLRCGGSWLPQLVGVRRDVFVDGASRCGGG
jgi:hypothetical protein